MKKKRVLAGKRCLKAKAFLHTVRGGRKLVSLIYD
jgi:hypothetical protein